MALFRMKPWYGKKSKVISRYGSATSLTRGVTSFAGASNNNYALFGGGAGSGFGQSDYRYNTVDTYNTSLVKGTATNLTNRASALAAASNNNYIMFGGGYSRGQNQQGKYTAYNFDTVNAYNSSLVKSSNTLSQGRSSLAATSVGDYVLFAGGVVVTVNQYGSISNTVYKDIVDAFDSSLTRILVQDSLTLAVSGLGATTLGNYALFAGGAASNSSYSSNVDCYNSSLTKTTVSNLSPRSSFGAASAGKYALFAGGYNPNTVSEVNYYKQVIEAYNSSLVKQTINKSIYADYGTIVGWAGVAGVTLDNYALFAGGTSYIQSTTVRADEVDVYNSSLTNSLVNGLYRASANMAAASVGNYALFAGGTNDDGNVDVYQAA